MTTTVWVLGDQLDRSLTALAEASPRTHRVLIVESDAKIASKRWHVQRAHLVVTSMRRFATALRDEGFDVGDPVGEPQQIDDMVEEAAGIGMMVLHAGGCPLEGVHQRLVGEDVDAPDQSL